MTDLLILGGSCREWGMISMLDSNSLLADPLRVLLSKTLVQPLFLEILHFYSSSARKLPSPLNFGDSNSDLPYCLLTFPICH